VNIRKGKQYLVYEFELDVDYRGSSSIAIQLKTMLLKSMEAML